MIPKNIKQPFDLQTTAQEIYKGFLEQAIIKSEKAKPFLERAKQFHGALKSVTNVQEVLSLKDFKDELIAASGFSDKAKAKMTDEELDRVLNDLLNTIFKNSGKEFKEEIIFRYLLTKGDSLGGSMRNITGALASKKFAELLMTKLSHKGITTKVTENESGKVQRLNWPGKQLYFDVTPRLIGKNIDVILINSSLNITLDSKVLNDRSVYVACGELKGGIDPAGADEHWKTANSALERIRRAFPTNTPKLFFIGAAIEASMAEEIFNQLQMDIITYAANLTKFEQLDDLMDWLLSL